MEATTRWTLRASFVPNLEGYMTKLAPHTTRETHHASEFPESAKFEGACHMGSPVWLELWVGFGRGREARGRGERGAGERQEGMSP